MHRSLYAGVVVLSIALVAARLGYLTAPGHKWIGKRWGWLCMHQVHARVDNDTFIDKRNHLRFRVPQGAYVCGAYATKLAGASRQVDLCWKRGVSLSSPYAGHVDYARSSGDPKGALAAALEATVKTQAISGDTQGRNTAQIFVKDLLPDTARGPQARLVFAVEPVGEESRATEVRYIATHGFILQVAYTHRPQSLNQLSKREVNTMFNDLIGSVAFD